MWKAIAPIVIVLMVKAIVATAAVVPDHLANTKMKFPYSLIGDDFGILNTDDLAIPTCHVLPKPYSSGLHGKELNSFSYWKCFPTTDVQVDCSNGGYDHDERSVLTVMGIIIKSGTEINEYFTRRAIPLRGCKNWQRDWKRLSKMQSYVCFSGSPLNKEMVVEGGHSWQRYSWIFESYKTQLGCSSYFEGGCSLRYQINHGCKVVETKTVFSGIPRSESFK